MCLADKVVWSHHPHARSSTASFCLFGDNNKAFIAVGLGHLYYKKGLIMQLIGSGYTVFPVAMHNNGPVVYKGMKKK